MKPTEKQRHFIKTIQNIVQLWIETNDINSPSHRTLIEETIDYELDGYPEGDKDLLKNAFWDLLTYIKTLERNENND